MSYRFSAARAAFVISVQESVWNVSDEADDFEKTLGVVQPTYFTSIQARWSSCATWPAGLR